MAIFRKAKKEPPKEKKFNKFFYEDLVDSYTKGNRKQLQDYIKSQLGFRHDYEAEGYKTWDTATIYITPRPFITNEHGESNPSELYEYWKAREKSMYIRLHSVFSNRNKEIMQIQAEKTLLDLGIVKLFKIEQLDLYDSI